MKIKKFLSLIAAAALIAGTLSMTSCSSEEGYNIPIVCGESGMNSTCGVATYGVDYYSLGVKAGDMAADVLLGISDISKMSVQTDPNPALTVNSAVAEQIGITIPESITSRATGESSNEVTRVESAIVESGADFTIGILQLTQHVALDQCNIGFIDQISVRMSQAGKTVAIDNQNASNETSNNVTIAENFVNKNVDLIYTIATSSSQAAAEATRESKIPVIFNAVTNPVDAGLVQSMEVSGGNVCGVSDINPVEKQIELIAEILGSEDITIGLLYTSAETNSVFQINMAKKYCNEKGYNFVEKGLGDINDIHAAFIALSEAGVDAIYIPTDNVIANSCATVHSLNIGE